MNASIKKAAAARLLWIFLFLFGGVAGSSAAVYDRQEHREPIAEGIDLLQIRQFDLDGWLNISALRVDLANPLLQVRALHAADRVTARERVSDIARRHRAAAAVNADFFHLGGTDAPIGIHIQNGSIRKTPGSGRELAFGILPGDTPFIDRIDFSGRLSIGEASHSLHSVNSPAAAANEIGYYDRRWDEQALGSQVSGFSTPNDVVYAVVDDEGRIVTVQLNGEGPTIPADGFVLLGRGSAGEWLAHNADPNARVSIDVTIEPPALDAVGGNPALLRDDEIIPDRGGPAHPRTAVGYTDDKSTLWLVVIDGRSNASRGVTLHELAEWMHELGAAHALNLDGGGSSALVARKAGHFDPVVRNTPSDGAERIVPNILGVFMNAPSQSMSRLILHLPVPEDLYPLSLDEWRVAQGATIRVPAGASDKHGNPIEIDSADLDWSVNPEKLGHFETPGNFLAAQPGTGKIAIYRVENGKKLSTTVPLRVIGETEALILEPTEISAQPGQQTRLRIYAQDAEGFRAPLAMREVSWEVLGNVGTIENDRFTAAPETASGALIAHFGDTTGAILVGVGGEATPVKTFDDISMWQARKVPDSITAELSLETDSSIQRADRPVAHLQYDFRGPTRTRAAYLRAHPDDLTFTQRPLQLGLWVYGDDNDAWLRGQIVDSSGVGRAIDFARHIDWNGWRYVQADIPPGTDYPIALRSLYVVETRGDAQPSGSIYFDQLEAVYAPEPDLEILDNVSTLRDSANRPAPKEPDSQPTFRFAVFGDSKVEAAQPESREANILRRSIERINEEPDLDFAIFTGDLIENDSPENYRFGRKMLEELNIPYHIAVANHEIAGTESFEHFREFFGPTYFGFSHKDARFLFLNAARPSLRLSEEEQWPWLREQLDNFEEEHLFITLHTPLIDPLPGGQTGWSDPLEIGLFHDLMRGIRKNGKNVFVFHGHVHGFDSRISDGVRYLTSAGSGSPLYLPPHRGGFFHYVIVSVSGNAVTYRVIPLLERIEAPAEVTFLTGKPARIEATGIGIEESVRFPLRYPAAIDWELTGEPVGRFDPVESVFYPEKAGSATLTIASGEARAAIRIEVNDR